MSVDDNSLTSFLSSALVSWFSIQVFFFVGFLVTGCFFISTTFAREAFGADFDIVFFFVTGAVIFFATADSTKGTFFFEAGFADVFTETVFLTVFLGELVSDVGFFGEAFFVGEEDFFGEDDAIER